MRFLATCCLLAGLAPVVAGCSRMETDPCAPDVRYATARSAPPVQVPDDLTPPDESEALRLPPDSFLGPPTTAGECLEKPPWFFGESRPFRLESDDDESRRERRERRRAERAAERTEAAAPTAQEQDEAEAERAPADVDRVITN
jgi:hypothetical protein